MRLTGKQLSATEEAVLKNDLTDAQQWLNNALAGKINNCKKRMIQEWMPKLMADESVGSIPANEDEMIALIVAREDYKSRNDREESE